MEKLLTKDMMVNVYDIQSVEVSVNELGVAYNDILFFFFFFLTNTWYSQIHTKYRDIGGRKANIAQRRFLKLFSNFICYTDV